MVWFAIGGPPMTLALKHGMERLHYSKAPITEAIIDFRVKPREGLTLSDVEQVHRGEEQSFPDVKRYAVVRAMIEGGERISASAEKDETGFVFTSTETKRVMQARIDGFTFSQMAPYHTWESFREEGRRLWTLYRERVSPIEVKRLAVRYINRFDLPGTKIELKDYFRTSPEVSPDLHQPMSAFFLRVMFPQEELKGQLIINQTIIPPSTPGVTSVVLDIDLYREIDVPDREEEIWQFFEQLHDRKNYVFEACITEPTRELIR